MEKVKVIPLVHVIYTAILAHMTLYGRSQGGFKVVGAQLGAGSRRSLRYIILCLCFETGNTLLKTNDMGMLI